MKHETQDPRKQKKCLYIKKLSTFRYGLTEENETHRGVWVFDFFYTQNRKLGNLGKSSVTSNFDSCNSGIESDKKMNWDKNQKGYDIV